MQVPFSFPTFTVKRPKYTCIQRPPLFSGRGYCLWSFLFLETCIKRTLQKIVWFFCPRFSISVIIKFANKMSCHRNTILCYSVLFLQNVCSCLTLSNVTCFDQYIYCYCILISHYLISSPLHFTKNTAPWKKDNLVLSTGLIMWISPSSERTAPSKG